MSNEKRSSAGAEIDLVGYFASDESMSNEKRSSAGAEIDLVGYFASDESMRLS